MTFFRLLFVFFVLLFTACAPLAVYERDRVADSGMALDRAAAASHFYQKSRQSREGAAGGLGGSGGGGCGCY